MKAVQKFSPDNLLSIFITGIFCLSLLFPSIPKAQVPDTQPPGPPVGFEQFKKDIEEIESAEERVKRYLDMSMRFAYPMPDSVFKLAEEVLNYPGLSKSKREAYSAFIFANAWRPLNRDSVIYYAEQSSEYLRQVGDHEAYLNMQNLLGSELSRKNEYVKADSVFKMAIAYSQTLEKVEYPVKYIYGNLGSLYSMVGAHGLAINMYERFLETENNPANRCNINSKLAVSLMEINENVRAIELLTPCLHSDQLPPQIKTIVRSNLSRMYQNLGEREKALELLKEAAEISVEYNVSNLKISNLIRLGDFYLKDQEIAQADSVRNLLEQATSGRITPNFQIDKSTFLAEYYIAKGEYKSALENADHVIQTAERFRMQDRMRNIYSIKAKAHEALGELDKAVEYLWMQSELEQMKHDRESERNLAMMAVRYQLQNKETQLQSATQELKTVKVRNALIILFIILLAFYVLYRYKIHYLFQQVQSRNRIARDLHDDLSGTLSSISFFSEAAKRVYPSTDGSEKYLQMIDKSAVEAKEKINDIIWAINPENDDWSSFLNKCKRYAADSLDSKGIEYELTFSENFNKPVSLELRQNLWLIFKEIINNLVRHSHAKNSKIEFRQVDKTIYLKVQDDGVGFDVNKETDRHGLKNIRHRAAQIHAELKLESSEKGTAWMFELT